MGKTMKKIALYIPSMNGGGAERVMLTLANALAEKDKISIDLVLNRAGGVYLKDISDKVNIVNLNTSRVLKSVIPLSQYLKKEKPDTILSAMNYVNVITVLAKLISGTNTRVILSEHVNLTSSLKDTKWLFRIAFKNIMKWTYKKSDSIIAVSNGVADDLSREIKINRNKIVTIYNPIFTPNLLEKAQSALPLQNPYFDRNTPPVILGVGRLAEEKDFKTLINAFAKVRNYKECHLMILGEGALRPELELLIKELDLQDSVQMPGFVDNPHSWMLNADLFVLSSIHEGFGNVLVEAMACGLPVVSTDCPSGPNEILEDGKWGELVPVGDVELLSKAIIKVMSKPSKIDVKERASFFSVENSVNKYLELLID